MPRDTGDEADASGRTGDKRAWSLERVVVAVVAALCACVSAAWAVLLLWIATRLLFH